MNLFPRNKRAGVNTKLKIGDGVNYMHACTHTHDQIANAKLFNKKLDVEDL